jgi:hypothetical protein
MEILEYKVTKYLKTADKEQYYKAYYLANQEKYREQNERRKSIYYTCDVCNCKVGIKNVKEHKRTNKHISNLKQ